MTKFLKMGLIHTGWIAKTYYFLFGVVAQEGPRSETNISAVDVAEDD
jgi:hypothetical protein